MRAYELIAILNPELDEEKAGATVDKVEKLISSHGGTVDNTSHWGKRRLAYEIGGHREGNYVVMNFHGRPDTVRELDRVLKITDEVIRYLIVKQEK